MNLMVKLEDYEAEYFIKIGVKDKSGLFCRLINTSVSFLITLSKLF